jgi:hypothetical protein
MKIFLVFVGLFGVFTGVAEAKLPVPFKVLTCMRGKLGPTCGALAACAQTSLAQFCDTYDHPCCSSSSADGAQSGSGPGSVGQPSGGASSGAGNADPLSSCSGKPMRGGLQNFLWELASYKSFGFKCVAVAKDKTLCCVEVTRCDGKLETYKAELSASKSVVESALSSAPKPKGCSK